MTPTKEAMYIWLNIGQHTEQSASVHPCVALQPGRRGEAEVLMADFDGLLAVVADGSSGIELAQGGTAARPGYTGGGP